MTLASDGRPTTSSLPGRLRRMAVTLPLVIALSACGGHVKGVMQPLNIAAEPKGNAVVDMLVATSRLPSGDPATLFSGERSVQASLTDVAVSIPSSTISPEIRAGRFGPEVPAPAGAGPTEQLVAYLGRQP